MRALQTSVPEHIIFTNYQKSVPEHHHFTFFGGFCRSGDHHFQNFFNFNPFIASHGQLSPNVQQHPWPFWRYAFSRSKQIKLVPEIRIFTLKTAQARSGAPPPPFSSSKRLKLVPEPTFSRSTGSPFRSPCPFSLCRGTYLPKFGVSSPPPPPGHA